MSRVGFLWCAVCKAWRPVQDGQLRCHRCDWDLRARIVTRAEMYRYWKDRYGKG